MAIRNFLKDFAKDVQAGWDVGKEASNINEKAKKQYRHSVFDPRFARDMSKGMEDIVENEQTIKGTRKLNNPAEFLGAYANRIATDVGTDSSRQFLWRYNHPMALAELAGNTVIGKEGMKKVKELTPTERAGIMSASIGMPAFASMGTIDATNPGELFRPKGYSQSYAGVGSEDRRKTEQPGLEAIDRFILGLRGKPLKYSEAKKDIPNLTPQKYSQFLKNYYQNKGVTGLGLLKFSGENLEGHPEARVLGFPIGLQGVSAVAGGAIGARTGLNPAVNAAGVKPLIKPRNIVAGMAVGKAANMAIASANRPKYPSTYEYTQNQ